MAYRWGKPLLSPVVLRLIGRLGAKEPRRAFVVTAMILLLLSFGMPFALGESLDMSTTRTLNLMYLITAAGVLAIVKPR